jgi:thiamine-monophosphate kinase
MSEPSMRRSPEFDLIAAIRERLGDPARAGVDVRIGIGDDAAVTVAGDGSARAVTIDALVDGVGFRRAWCPPRAVGRKAAGAALSDIAAMGAEPAELYAWLGIPEDLDRDEALELCDGLAEVAAAAGAALLGGDLTRSAVLAVSVTAIGRAAPGERLVGRAGARPGDAVCVTGSLGGAAAGLMLLEHPELVDPVPAADAEAARGRQLEPEPRIAAGRALAAAGASAMIDLSDGLGADAEHLAAASGIAIEIELDRVPVGAGVAPVAAAAGRDPVELVAAGGEDYELLCAIPRAQLGACREAVAATGVALSEIGRAESGAAVRLRLPGGRSVRAAGHDHLRGP